ncbi:MAG: hypothetical protein QNL24_03255 [Akkermansiaceae bacterium]|jgi:hypothetical protein
MGESESISAFRNVTGFETANEVNPLYHFGFSLTQLMCNPTCLTAFR